MDVVLDLCLVVVPVLFLVLVPVVILVVFGCKRSFSCSSGCDVCGSCTVSDC